MSDRQTTHEATIPAGAPWGYDLRKGQTLRIVDLHGRQAVDFLCFNAEDPIDRYHAPNTIKAQNNVFISQGTVLYSTRATPLMTVGSDTCGHHDTLGGCCSAQSNTMLYGERGEGNCRDNLLTAMAEFGLTEVHLVPNINFFMYVPINQDGSAEISTGPSQPGDYIELVANLDVIVTLSNCPQIFNAANDFNPTDIGVAVM